MHGLVKQATSPWTTLPGRHQCSRRVSAWAALRGRGPHVLLLSGVLPRPQPPLPDGLRAAAVTAVTAADGRLEPHARRRAVRPHGHTVVYRHVAAALAALARRLPAHTRAPLHLRSDAALTRRSQCVGHAVQWGCSTGMTDTSPGFHTAPQARPPPAVRPPGVVGCRRLTLLKGYTTARHAECQARASVQVQPANVYTCT